MDCSAVGRFPLVDYILCFGGFGRGRNACGLFRVLTKLGWQDLAFAQIMT